MAPLTNIEKIEARLDAITDLMTFQSETDILRARLQKLPDLEKLLAKIFTYSIKHSVKAIYFEDVSLQKMKEFRTLLNCFKNIDNTIESLTTLRRREELNSARLLALISTKDEHEQGLMPTGILETIHHFDKLIQWKRVPGTTNEIPEPQQGIDQDFDAANDAVNDIKGELDEFLQGIQRRYKDRRICFSHAKNRYEIEIPEEHVKGAKKPKEFELTSTRKGYERFYTPELKALVE